MIPEIRSSLAAFYESQRAPGEALRDFKAVREGDQDQSRDFHPLITIEFDNASEMRMEGSRSVCRFRFAITAYTSSLASVRESASKHLEFLCRVEGEKVVGLLPATLRLLRRSLRIGNIVLRMTAEPEVQSAAIKNGSSWTIATVQTIWLETWLNPDQM